MPTLWEPKPGADPYVIVTTPNVWGQVKAKWKQLGSPDAQCPSPRYGEVGSVQNQACRDAVGPIWDRFEDVIPDLPETAPHYSISDVVPVEEVCALGYYDDPEADIGPPPNLFENPGALAMKLQEWYLRSLIPSLCQPVEQAPLEGGCWCWPYFVTTKSEWRSQRSGEWVETESTSPAFGPVRGAGYRVDTLSDGVTKGVLIFIRGQDNPGGIRYGGTADCTLGIAEYPTAGGTGYDEARGVAITKVIPFTLQDMDFYGIPYSGLAPPGDGFCPVPTAAPPLKDYPNTRPVYMPLPIPRFVFPAAPGCPVGQEDYMIFNVNVEGAVGPKGDKGEDGKEGKDGPTMIKTIARKSNVATLGETNPGEGNYGGEFSIPRGCACVEVKFKVPFVEEDLYRERRVYFAPPEGGLNRIEGSWGNAHLVVGDGQGGSLPRVQFSRLSTSVEVPEGTETGQWRLIVVDKGDVGVEVIDTGMRHVIRKVSNPDDVPTFEYTDPL